MHTYYLTVSAYQEFRHNLPRFPLFQSLTSLKSKYWPRLESHLNAQLEEVFLPSSLMLLLSGFSSFWAIGLRHKSVVAILCVECFQVARTLSKSSRHPQDVLFSHFVDGVTGAQRGRMTFPRPHTKGGIQNQASSKISRAGSTPSLQPPPPPQNSDVTSPSIPRVDLFLVLSCFLEDLRDLVGVLSSIQCRWRFLPCLLSQDDVLLVFDSPE